MLAAGLGLILAGQVTAQTFTTLYNFTALYHVTNSDGAFPAGLFLAGNTLFGTASVGGIDGSGTVFALNTDGTGFSVVHSFNATCIPCTNSGGARPLAGLVLSGATLYGTTSAGGSGGFGTVFAVNTNGTGFTNLHNFTYGVDGGSPTAELILSGNTLYGTTGSGGGTVFALNTDGTGFTNLHNFTTARDGVSPQGGVILSGTTLYGTASGGGSGGSGTASNLIPTALGLRYCIISLPGATETVPVAL